MLSVRPTRNAAWAADTHVGRRLSSCRECPNMRRMILVTMAVGMVAGAVSQAGAVGFDSAVRYVKSGYHRNVEWPWPYVCDDRIAVRQPFAIMVNNGWRHQNLLGQHHFDPTTEQLTKAGELKVQWIATQTPPNRRQIFVERSINPQVTEQRMAVARDYAAHIGTDGQPPQVYDTYLVSEGRPASIVDAVNVRFHESMPPPVLPATTYTGLGGLSD